MTANQSNSSERCDETARPKLSAQEQEIFLKQLAEIEREEAAASTPPAEDK